jgi:glycine/D-amino acid oxidase-like deaminating enzyme
MATIKRDLRTGVPVWHERRVRRVPTHELHRDLRTDVLVVGAGISGALVAELLAADGHRVAIVDRRGACKGSTAASTALVQYEIDEPLIRLAKKIGEAAAVRAWRRSHQALQGLAARTRALGIACDAERRDTLYLAGDLLNAGALKREVEARRAAALETTYLTRAALRDRFGIARSAALLGYGDLEMDPRQLTAGYLRAALGRGARLYAPVEVTEVVAAARHVRARTKRGPAIRCRHLVFATGYELPHYVPATGHRIVSTYAMATRPQPRRLWPERCFIWEAANPYLYLRATRDGRVIVGGEDEPFADEAARDALLPSKIETLRKKLGRLFPRLDPTPTFGWTATFGASDTGLPSIGEIPGMKNCFAVLGYGGNGITYSRLAAEIIRTTLAGKVDPDADLYAFRGARARRPTRSKAPIGGAWRAIDVAGRIPTRDTQRHLKSTHSPSP